MKKNTTIVIFALFLSSCINIDDYVGSSVLPNASVDTSIDFSTRKDFDISIKALSYEGKGMNGIPVGIYLENPYNTDGTRGDVKPVSFGYTDDNGILSTKVAIPASVDKIYIFSEFAGCPIKEVSLNDLSSQIDLDMNVITEASRSSRASDAEVIRECRDLGISAANDINLHQFYTQKEVNEWGIPQVSKSNALIANCSYPTGLYTLINKTYPENVENHKDEVYWKKNTDLVIDSETGTEIWVSFAGDGGFADKSAHNSLAYYTYPDGMDISQFSDEQIKSLHKTILFPSLQDNKISSEVVDASILPHGRRVKLMYYDEVKKKYTTIFPKGLRLGFMFIQNGFNTSKNSSFKSKGYGSHINDLTCLRFTTAEFNKACGVKGTKGENDPFFGDGVSRGIARNLQYGNEEYNVVGMDYTYGTNQNGNDKDLNDALVIVESSPYIYPNDEVPAPDPEPKINYESNLGTLAFEDTWPNKGDYDFNDFVIDYEYSLGKLENYVWNDVARRYDYFKGNKINEVKLTFKPRAIGAAFESGFAIEIPFKESDIDKSKLELPNGVKLEEGHDNAVFVVYNNTRDAFKNANGYINTQQNMPKVEASSLTINIPLINPIEADNNSSSLLGKFNPFIFVLGRSNEIHLVDKSPTNLQNMENFGKGLDHSVPSENIYYRMDNKYPWALDIARKSAKEVWQYPLENVIITKGYTKYDEWESNTSIDWWNSNKNKESLFE